MFRTDTISIFFSKAFHLQLVGFVHLEPANADRQLCGEVKVFLQVLMTSFVTTSFSSH